MAGPGTTAVHGGASEERCGGRVGTPIYRTSTFLVPTTRDLLAARTPAERAAAGVGQDLVRLWVGLEDVEHLWADIEGALR